MKTRIIFLFAALLFAVSCEHPYIEEETEENHIEGPTKKFTFTLKGDFSDAWNAVTRGYLQADGKDMTDVWVLDYDGEGNLIQQIHQDDNTADDFGRPVMHLSYGSHHVYFIATRSTGAVLNTTTKTITFDKVLDTFWADYPVEVVSTSNGNRAVTLNRKAAKLKCTFTDAIKEGTTHFLITPNPWYYGFNYTTGQATESKTDTPIQVNVVESAIGKENQTVSIFGISNANWTTSVTIAAYAGETLLGKAHVDNVIVQEGKESPMRGPLFSSDGEFTMSLNTEWESLDPVTW